VFLFWARLINFAHQRTINSSPLFGRVHKIFASSDAHSRWEDKSVRKYAERTEINRRLMDLTPTQCTYTRGRRSVIIISGRERHLQHGGRQYVVTWWDVCYWRLIDQPLIWSMRRYYCEWLQTALIRWPYGLVGWLAAVHACSAQHRLMQFLVVSFRFSVRLMHLQHVLGPRIRRAWTPLLAACRPFGLSVSRNRWTQMRGLIISNTWWRFADTHQSTGTSLSSLQDMARDEVNLLSFGVIHFTPVSAR